MKDPYEIWGQDLSKMRYRAFKDYKKNLKAALKKWPEFRIEYYRNVLRKDIKEQYDPIEQKPRIS